MQFSWRVNYTNESFIIKKAWFSKLRAELFSEDKVADMNARSFRFVTENTPNVKNNENN